MRRRRLRHQQCQRLESLDLDLTLYLRCPYMGQWTWLTTRWRDCNRPLSRGGGHQPCEEK